jgi:hypothetical protein
MYILLALQLIAPFTTATSTGVFAWTNLGEFSSKERCEQAAKAMYDERHPLTGMRSDVARNICVPK